MVKEDKCKKFRWLRFPSLVHSKISHEPFNLVNWFRCQKENETLSRLSDSNPPFFSWSARVYKKKTNYERMNERKMEMKGLQGYWVFVPLVGSFLSRTKGRWKPNKKPERKNERKKQKKCLHDDCARILFLSLQKVCFLRIFLLFNFTH